MGGQLAIRPLATEATEATEVTAVLGMRATVGMVLEDMGATAMVGMGLATAPWALLVDMVAMQGQAPMWPPILVRSTLQRGQLSQRRNPNMQLATLGSVATLPWDTLRLLTLPWATPATQGDMGFTTAMEATVDSTEAPTTAEQKLNSSH